MHQILKGQVKQTRESHLWNCILLIAMLSTIKQIQPDIYKPFRQNHSASLLCKDINKDTTYRD